MKKLIFYSILFITLIYLLISFYTLTIYPNEWQIKYRGAFCVGVLFSIAFAGMIKSFENL